MTPPWRPLLGRLLWTVDGCTCVPPVSANFLDYIQLHCYCTCIGTEQQNAALSWWDCWTSSNFIAKQAWCVFHLLHLLKFFWLTTVSAILSVACFFVLEEKSLNSTSWNTSRLWNIYLGATVLMQFNHLLSCCCAQPSTRALNWSHCGTHIFQWWLCCHLWGFLSLTNFKGQKYTF